MAGLKTFFSDGDASPTPFNVFNNVKKNLSKTKNKNRNYNEAMVAAADTIQGLSQKRLTTLQKLRVVIPIP